MSADPDPDGALQSHSAPLPAGAAGGATASAVGQMHGLGGAPRWLVSFILAVGSQWVETGM